MGYDAAFSLSSFLPFIDLQLNARFSFLFSYIYSLPRIHSFLWIAVKAIPFIIIIIVSLFSELLTEGNFVKMIENHCLV